MFRMKTPPFVGSNNIFCIMKIDTLNFWDDKWESKQCFIWIVVLSKIHKDMCLYGRIIWEVVGPKLNDGMASWMHYSMNLKW